MNLVSMNNGQGEPNVSEDGTAFALQGDVHNYVAGTLGGHHGNVRADQAWTGQLVEAFGGNNTSGAIDVATARSSKANRYDFETENFLVANSLDGGERGFAPRGDGTDNIVVAGALRASDGHHGHSSPRGDGGDNLIALQRNAGVRRLTPLECERLMGWPDDFTKYAADGREIPDSHRYRMCGNGVVATVAEWIGHRLVWVETQT